MDGDADKERRVKKGDSNVCSAVKGSAPASSATLMSSGTKMSVTCRHSPRCALSLDSGSPS